jgi:hypothetical protein
LPIGYADVDVLPLAQTHYACLLKRGNVHEDIVSAAVQDDETEPLGGVVPLHRPISWTLASKGYPLPALVAGKLGDIRSR